MIHADIAPHHVHRDGVQWSLIDWGSMHTSEIWYDYFLRYIWGTKPLSQETAKKRAFWAWMRGEVTKQQLPLRIRATIDLFVRWQNDWIGIDGDADALRYTMLVSQLKSLNPGADAGGQRGVRFMHRLNGMG
jgi:hypothetical protein